MEKHRIGKDFFYTFTLTDNTGAAIDFTNAKNIVLEVYRDSAFTSVQNYSITGNKVTFQWSSAENKKLGIYNLSMQWDLVNSNSETGYMHNFADKKNIFQIVTSSEEETESDSVNLTVTQYGGVDGKSGRSPYIKDGTWYVYNDSTEEYENTGISVSSDYILTKENIEKLLAGDITSHNHASQIAEILSGYVKSVVGKNLSTNDFNNELLTKLNSLENYDDASIKNAVNSLQTQLNTLLSNNVSSAIESFNEIISFLSNISDKDTLSGIISGIQTTISNNLITSESYSDEKVKSHDSSSTSHSDIRTLISNESSSRESAILEIKNSLDSEIKRSKNTDYSFSNDLASKAGIISKISVTGTSPSQTINPNTFYVFSEPVTSLTITLDKEIDNIYNEYMFQFVSDSTVAATLNFSDTTIKFVNTVAIEKGKTYQVSIVNNLAVIGGV